MNIILSIAVTLTALAADVPVDVSVTLDAPETPFHRPARYTITVEAPAGLDVSLPKLENVIEGLEVNHEGTATELLGDGRHRHTQVYLLDPVNVADYVIPAQEVRVGEEDVFVAPAVALRVRDLTDSEREQAENFEDIVEPPEVTLASSRAFWIWTGVAIAVLALSALAGYLLWWRKTEEESAPPVPPWQVALNRLRELERRELPAKAAYQPYYVDLSAILRYYIEDRFHLHAPEQTTPEFLEDASKSGLLSDEQQDVLSAFLKHCDRVKFARYRPTREEMEDGFRVVHQFVRDTVPRPETPGATEAAA